MVTPSHVIINSALAKRIGLPARMARFAFICGGFMPDVPLAAMYVMNVVIARYIYGLDTRALSRSIFEDKFFNDPLWIAAHNLFHAPILLLFAIVILWRYRARVETAQHWMLWFALGCLTHTCIDILCHVTDGPLLFFPFDWHTRFHSPVSYWDRRYYGREFSIFEYSLDFLLLVYLSVAPALRLFRRLCLNRLG